eukprot:scaffold104315_cov75-Phaeocystis_antarctica.AAC.3
MGTKSSGSATSRKPSPIWHCPVLGPLRQACSSLLSKPIGSSGRGGGRLHAFSVVSGNFHSWRAAYPDRSACQYSRTKAGSSTLNA